MIIICNDYIASFGRSSTLFSEALSSTALLSSSVFDMTIGLQQIDWFRSQDSSMDEIQSLGSASTELHFVLVLAKFLKNSNGDFPSLHALDSHVHANPDLYPCLYHRTSRFYHIWQVTADISVALIDTTSSPTSAPDIILIVASTSIVHDMPSPQRSRRYGAGAATSPILEQTGPTNLFTFQHLVAENDLRSKKMVARPQS
jgi:hypothetical protein